MLTRFLGSSRTRWSADVTEHSHALDLCFTDVARAIQTGGVRA